MIRIFKAILDEAYNQIKGKALIAPVIAAALISGATTIGSKIIADIKAKKLAERLDKEKAEAIAEEKRLANQQIEAAKGVVRRGDPTLAEKQRQIKEAGANVVGKATATSQSTQEIINAAQATQANVDKAQGSALSQAGQRDLEARKLLADRFGQAGRQRLLGTQIVNQEAQAALNAIGANAQATVSSLQNVGSTVLQAYGLSGGFETKEKFVPKTFSLT